MFAVIFDLEGQLDCTLHATETEASKEAARLSEKYAAERANYSASVAVQAVTMPAPFAAAPAMLALISQIARMSSQAEADGQDMGNDLAMDGLIARSRAIIAAATGTPTGEGAGAIPAAQGEG